MGAILLEGSEGEGEARVGCTEMHGDDIGFVTAIANFRSFVSQYSFLLLRHQSLAGCTPGLNAPDIASSGGRVQIL